MGRSLEMWLECWNPTIIFVDLAAFFWLTVNCYFIVCKQLILYLVYCQYVAQDHWYNDYDEGMKQYIHGRKVLTIMYGQIQFYLKIEHHLVEQSCLYSIKI